MSRGSAPSKGAFPRGLFVPPITVSVVIAAMLTIGYVVALQWLTPEPDLLSEFGAYEDQRDRPPNQGATQIDRQPMENGFDPTHKGRGGDIASGITASLHFLDAESLERDGVSEFEESASLADDDYQEQDDLHSPEVALAEELNEPR